MALGDPLRAAWAARILVADDEDVARRILRRILEPAGYEVIEAADGDAAFRLVKAELPDLVILDIGMPGTDGIEVCRRIKANPITALTPVIHVTGANTREQRLAALHVGSDEFVGKPFDIEELLVRVRSLLRTKRVTDHLVSAEAVLVALARAVEIRDRYTERHLHRVADRAVRVAEAMDVAQPIIESVRLGGLLHDVGKIAIPDRVLLKAGPLDRPEFELVKLHPTAGAELVRPLARFSAPEPAVLHHHERWDGDGYPGGLKGAQIPLPARIVAVADSFDAITTDRPYRAGRPAADAFEILVAGRGSQWDPDVVDNFVHLFAYGPIDVGGGFDEEGLVYASAGEPSSPPRA